MRIREGKYGLVSLLWFALTDAIHANQDLKDLLAKSSRRPNSDTAKLEKAVVEAGSAAYGLNKAARKYTRHLNAKKRAQRRD